MLCPKCNTPLVPDDGRMNSTVTSLKVKPSSSRSESSHMEVNEDLCVGCGLCARECPQHAIAIIDKKAHIDFSKCICCQICAETCRKGVIKIL